MARRCARDEAQCRCRPCAATQWSSKRYIVQVGEVGSKDRAWHEGGNEADNVSELTVVAATALSSTTVGIHDVG